MTLELSDTGEILSYEESSPFGQTTYRAPVKRLGTPKLYRFSATRTTLRLACIISVLAYYAPGLGRWFSPGLIGIGDGPNVYCYVDCNPVSFVDPDGKGRKSGSSGSSAKKSTTVTTKQRKVNEKEVERVAAAATVIHPQCSISTFVSNQHQISQPAKETWQTRLI